MPGVLLVMTYQNAMRLPNGGVPDAQPPAVRKLTLLQTNEVRYSNEPVAVVIADSLEHAQRRGALRRRALRSRDAQRRFRARERLGVSAGQDDGPRDHDEARRRRCRTCGKARRA